MAANVVKVSLEIPVVVDCEFRLEDDVWSGFSRQLAVQVTAPEFEQAKKLMQDRLKEKIERLLWNLDQSDRRSAA
jgi:hypothetical protein